MNAYHYDYCQFASLGELLIRENCDLKADRAELMMRLDELEAKHRDELYWYRRYRELLAKQQ